jgi:hypothetical protein
MRNNLIGLLLLITISINAQWTDKDTSFQLQLKEVKADRSEKWKVIALYSGSIILNGIGDAKNDMNQKTVGHLFNAASIGTLVLSPAVFNYKKDKWYLYVISYTLLRAGLFDVTYNLTRKLPYNYTGSTSVTDKMYNFFGNQPTFPRGVFFIVGFSIPLNNL